MSQSNQTDIYLNEPYEGRQPIIEIIDESADGKRKVVIRESEGMITLSSMIDGYHYRSWPVNDDLLRMIKKIIQLYFNLERPL